ncbi:MAG: glucosamine-6-phosphate deaminase [Hyphomicrobiales bacterium]|nr:glucosamine-6-phosphate deaminase [Hyphomicrobiales bacterium]
MLGPGRSRFDPGSRRSDLTSPAAVQSKKGGFHVKLELHSSKQALGAAAAAAGAKAIRDAIARRGASTIVVATGMSQLEMFDHLVRAKDVDWSKVTAFHLDEYVGLAASHPASFRRYLNERFVSRLPTLKSFVRVEGDAQDLDAEVARLNGRLRELEVDVCFAGIGENCHLAFNDPPADFNTEDPYLVVELDEACRRQQLGEGWFPSLADVPRKAISMSVRQIMKAGELIVSVPDLRKAAAAKSAIEGEVSPQFPASILQRHARCTLFLDPPAASMLTKRKIA